MFADEMTDENYQNLKFGAKFNIPFSKQEGTNVNITPVAKKNNIPTTIAQDEYYGPEEFIGPQLPGNAGSSTGKVIASISIISILGIILSLKK